MLTTHTLEILTEEQIEAIHKGTVAVLERVGLRIEHERALKLFESNGCRVDYNEMRVRIPPALVEDSIRKCPNSIHLKARDAKNNLVMGGDSFLVTTFPGLQMLGLDSLEPRTPTRKEFHGGVKVLDALENLHFISQYTPYFGFEGVPQAMRLPESFAARARNSSHTFTNSREEILNYFDYRIINGFVEGKNNRIKTIKRMAYGYCNMDNFRLRILATNPDCEDKRVCVLI